MLCFDNNLEHPTGHWLCDFISRHYGNRFAVRLAISRTYITNQTKVPFHGEIWNSRDRYGAVTLVDYRCDVIRGQLA